MTATTGQSPTRGRRKSYMLRVDEALFDELKKWADQEFRSVNGQIEMILKRAVDERRKRPGRESDDGQDILHDSSL